MAITPVLLTAAVLVAFRNQAGASSHREAPAISKDAFADNTDLYAFISPEDDNNIVLASSWIPLEGPEGGPNYYEWDPNALYDIYVSSRVVNLDPTTFLYAGNNGMPINNLSDPSWNRQQFITVTETTADGTVTNLVANQHSPGQHW
jgi:hypothetical protein